jgi:hypothetical protein
MKTFSALGDASVSISIRNANIKIANINESNERKAYPIKHSVKDDQIIRQNRNCIGVTSVRSMKPFMEQRMHVAINCRNANDK